jgi:hypothetical protein
MNEHFDAFEGALRGVDAYAGLRQVVKDLVESGTDREGLRQELEAFRVEFRSKGGREDQDDVVLDVLDDLTGWTSPHRKL